MTCNHDTCKARNVVERSLAAGKQWRGLATRYDKLAIVYRAGAVLAAIITWLRTQETRLDDPVMIGAGLAGIGERSSWWREM